MAYNFSIDVDSGSTHNIPVNTDLTTYDVFLELRDSDYVKYDNADLTVGESSVVLVISQPAIEDFVNKAYRLKATKNGITHIYQSGVVSDNRVIAGPPQSGGGDGTGPINPDRITVGSISTDKIATGAITASKIAVNAVTTSSIATGSITASKLVDNSVINDKINNNAVSLSKLSSEVAAKLLTDSDRQKIDNASAGTPGVKGDPGDPGLNGADGINVRSGLGSPSRVGVNGESYIDVNTGDTYQWNVSSWSKTGNIAGPQGPQGEQGAQGVAGVKGDKGDSTAGSATLADGSVVTTKIADGAVTAAKIASVVITNAHIATNAAINADKLAAGTTNKMFTATEKTKLAGLAVVASSGSYNDLANLPVIPVVPAYGTAADTVTQGNDVRLSDARTPLDASVTTAKLTDGIISNSHVSATAAISADKIAAGTTNGVYTLTEKSKLAGVASNATANSSNAVLLARANHTGTQAATTITGLATVATTGVYTDLTSRPTLATVATSGSYVDLTNKPTLSTVATTGSYTDLTNKPSVAVVNKYTGSAYPTRPTADVVIWRGTVDPGSAALDGDYWDDVS